MLRIIFQSFHEHIKGVWLCCMKSAYPVDVFDYSEDRATDTCPWLCKLHQTVCMHCTIGTAKWMLLSVPTALVFIEIGTYRQERSSLLISKPWYMNIESKIIELYAPKRYALYLSWWDVHNLDNGGDVRFTWRLLAIDVNVDVDGDRETFLACPWG